MLRQRNIGKELRGGGADGQVGGDMLRGKGGQN